MPSSNPTQIHDSPHQSDPTHVPTPQNESVNPPLEETIPPPQNDTVLDQIQETNEPKIEGEEEEEGECGFCLFMKAGGCRDPFIEWEKCVDEGEKNKEDIVEKCHSVTKALKECMEAHPDHYGPILQAEKAAEAEAVREFDKEGNVESKAEPEVGSNELGLVEEAVATVEVVEMENASDHEQKVAS